MKNPGISNQLWQRALRPSWNISTHVVYLMPMLVFIFEEPLTEIKIAAINYLAEATHHLWQLEGGT